MTRRKYDDLQPVAENFMDSLAYKNEFLKNVYLLCELQMYRYRTK